MPEASTAAAPIAIRQVLIRVWPRLHQPAERVGPYLGRRQQEVGDLVQQPVVMLSWPRMRSRTAGSGRIILRVGEGVRYAARRAGAVGRLHHVFEGRHEILLRRFQRCQVVGQRRSEPVIARRGGDGRRVEQRERRRVELGDLEVVGAGCGPAERRLLHLVLQEIEGSVACLRCIGLERAVDGALDARGGRRELAACRC